jgi:hypothetical protein
MKYMLLIHDQEGAWATFSEAERRNLMAEYGIFTQDIQADGRYIGGARLQPTATATSVRIRDGKRLVIDGPFAETREQLGGYYIIDVPNLDEAISLAARIPSARFGTVEIRPIVESPAS